MAAGCIFALMTLPHPRWPFLVTVTAACLFAAGTWLALQRAVQPAMGTTGDYQLKTEQADVFVRVSGSRPSVYTAGTKGIVDITYDEKDPSHTLLTAAADVHETLGTACVRDALAPLVAAEAMDGGQAPYLAQLAADVVTAGYEAGRFGHPLMSEPVGAAIAGILLALVFLTWRMGRNLPLRTYSPSVILLHERETLEAELSGIESAVAGLERTRTEWLATVPAAPASLWDRVGYLARQKQRRHQESLLTLTAGIDLEIGTLQRRSSVILAALARNSRRSSADGKVFGAITQRTIFIARWLLTALKGVSLVSLLLGLAFVSIVVAYAGMPVVGREDGPILLRSDTVLSGALAARTGFAEKFAASCGIAYSARRLVSRSPGPRRPLSHCIPPRSMK